MFTFETVKRFRKTLRGWRMASLRRPKPRSSFKPRLEVLEERWCPAGGGGNSDTLVWDPTPGSQDPGIESNWFDKTTNKTSLVLPTPSNPVIFDAAKANLPITIAALEVKTLTVQNGYNALISLGTKFQAGQVIDNGTFTEDATSTLNVYFGNQAQFQISGGGNITNMVLSGYPTGTLILNGGTMTIAQSSSYTETSGVNITVSQGATLQDNSYTTLNLSNSGLILGVYGSMKVFYGTGSGSTLISRNGFSNDWINVSGGTLTYLGNAGVADTIDMNVEVQNAGNFILKTAGGATNGASLTVIGDPTYVSVWLTGAGNPTVQLNESATLVCYNGYSQDGGTLETMDASSCTLQIGAGAKNPAAISGGTVIIDAETNTYGVLNIVGNVNFAATLQIAIQGNASGRGNCDLLNVIGSLTLKSGSTLTATVNGGLVAGNNWVIINNDNAFGQNNNFSSTNLAQVGLTPNLNKPQNGNYQLQS